MSDDRRQVNDWLRGAVDGPKQQDALNAQGPHENALYQEYHRIRTDQARGALSAEEAEARVKGLMGAGKELAEEAKNGKLIL